MPVHPSQNPKSNAGVLKDGLYCVLTAFGFLGFLFLFASIYAWIESKLPNSLQSPLFFWEFCAILQAPAIIPTFRSANKSSSFPTWKHLFVILEIAALTWAFYQLFIVGRILASALGFLVFFASIFLPLSPIFWYFTSKSKHKHVTRVA